MKDGPWPSQTTRSKNVSASWQRRRRRKRSCRKRQLARRPAAAPIKAKSPTRAVRPQMAPPPPTPNPILEATLMPRKPKRHDTRAQPPAESAPTPSDDAAAASTGRPATAGAPQGQYAPALKAGFRATTSRVQEMHHAIAGKTFDALQMVPGVSVPARVVQSAHDAIADGVYAAVRHAGSAMLSMAGAAEAMTGNPQHQPGAKEQAVRSALNGVFGDSLAQANNA